jgi:hypothetical protein
VTFPAIERLLTDRFGTVTDERWFLLGTSTPRTAP